VPPIVTELGPGVTVCEAIGDVELTVHAGALIYGELKLSAQDVVAAAPTVMMAPKSVELALTVPFDPAPHAPLPIVGAPVACKPTKCTAVQPPAIALAHAEGLPAHAASVEVRL